MIAGTAGLGALTLLVAVTASRDPLVSPFDKADAMALAISATEERCAPPPPPVYDIVAPSKFGESRREHDSTVIDPDTAAEYAESTRPVSEFSRRVTRLSDSIAERRPTARRDAGCALIWLDSWAAKDALLGEMNPTGEAVRKWELAALASAYLKVRRADQDPAKAARVERWLERLGEAVRADYSRDTKLESRSNNHINWAAWAVMTAAVASNDRGLFEWSIGRFRSALAQIANDGTLPLELKRRQLAAGYHAFALGPLILLREGAERNAAALSAEEDARLQALVERVMASLDDPRFFAEKTGYEQDTSKLTDAQVAWLEPYYARSHDPEALRLLEMRRPLASSRLGGNLTALYREPATPPAVPQRPTGKP